MIDAIDEKIKDEPYFRRELANAIHICAKAHFLNNIHL